ncbi:MAG: restriction endonuclease [Candidatus Dadabacteria bacterium]|nr:restriction endonuclease [Candidatus Dadabacteria bacterium]
MPENQTVIKFDRCSLCRSEYIRVSGSSLSLDHVRSMNIGDYKELVIHVLKEHDYEVFESDKSDPNKVDSFMLESHSAEKHRWHVKSWSLFECRKQDSPVNSGDMKKFHELVISDDAERGYVITTSSFTEDSKKFIKDKPIELIDGKAFLNLLLKASSSGEYCRECRRIPTSIRALLKKLRAKIEALNRLEHEVSGKWTAPLNLDLMFREIVRKTKAVFKAVSKLEKKRLETKLAIKINNIISSVVRMTNEIYSFEKMVKEFTGEKEK